jgi:uncharacterized protein
MTLSLYAWYMIIELTLKNFRSFKDDVTLSMKAAPLRSEKDIVVKTETDDLLPAVGVFGPNASGKSNLIKAISFIKWAARNTDALNHPTTQHEFLSPFKLDQRSQEDPSFFQVVLWDSEKKAEYRYGFEIDGEAVVSEWLEVTAKEASQRRTRTIFSRDKQSFDIHKSMVKELKQRSADVPSVVLALASFANANNDLAYRVVSMLGPSNLVVVDGANEMNPQRALERCRKDPVFKQKVLSFLEQAGMGIKDLVIDEVEMPEDVLKYFTPEFVKQMKKGRVNLSSTTVVSTAHKVRGKTPKDKDTFIVFNLQNDESLGTQRFLVLTCFVLEALERGSVFVLDELGASLHPFLTGAIVRLFQDKKSNPKNAQLIFSSHETYLLSKHSNLRRDQIWFTNINSREESTLESLIKYKTRHDFEVAKNYLERQLGAVPEIEYFRL